MNPRISAASVGMIVVMVSLLAPAQVSAYGLGECVDSTVLVLDLDQQSDRAIESTVTEECVALMKSNATVSCGVVEIRFMGHEQGRGAVPCPFDPHDLDTAIKSLSPQTLYTAVLVAMDWAAEGGVDQYISEHAEARPSQPVLDPLTVVEDLALPIDSYPRAASDEDHLANGQCRTAETPASEGEWSIVVPTDYVGSLDPDFGSFAAVGAVSLDFLDYGQTYQEICYHPGEWTPQAGTQVPSSGGTAVAGCAAGVALMVGGAALVVAGASSAPVGGMALIAAGIGLFGAGAALAATSCPAMSGDSGWMHCTGYAMASWGGGGGNSYESRLLELTNIVELTAGSEGPGYQEKRFNVLHNGPGYWKGVASCDSQLEQARADAYAVYQNWGATASGSEDATAHITARLDLNGLDLRDLMQCQDGFVPMPGICFMGGVLIVGCESEDCLPEVVLSVQACGMQTITEGNEGVTYEFTGAVGCVDISLTVDGQTVVLEDLPLRLDGRFAGQGGNWFS